MPCYAPLTAYRGDVGKSGKRRITFDRSASFSGVKLSLPCGQCVGCRLERSRQWAVRIMHENKMHDESMFVTLTYDNEHLPDGNSLVKKDLSAFMKRLHNRLLRKRDNGVRYYGCGEYGETNGRPHYHAVVFGYEFSDKKYFSSNGRGEKLYTSELCRELWPFGHNAIGDVSFDSAAYVARYVVDKITGEKAEAHYAGRTPEFALMSRNPGIGKVWYDAYNKEAYTHDSVIMNGVEMRPPRYYDGKYELVDSDRLSVLKDKRRKRALKHRKDNTVDRRRVRETVALKRLKMYKRDP